MHTDPNDLNIYREVLGIGGDDWLTNTSLQVHGEGGSPPDRYGNLVQEALAIFAGNTGPSGSRSVIVDMDENGSPQDGAGPNNATGTSSPDDRRRRVLWDVYFGGGNLMWYFGNRTESNGGGDHNLENFRNRSMLFAHTKRAHGFVMRLDLPNYVARDGVVSNACNCGFGKPRVFSKTDEATFVYYGELFDGSTYTPGTIDLTQLTSGPATFKSYWYLPENGTVEGPTTVGSPRPAVTCLRRPRPPSQVTIGCTSWSSSSATAAPSGDRLDGSRPRV